MIPGWFNIAALIIAALWWAFSAAHDSRTAVSNGVTLQQQVNTLSQKVDDIGRKTDVVQGKLDLLIELGSTTQTKHKRSE